VIHAPGASRWRVPDRTGDVLLFGAVVSASVIGGASVVSDGRIAKLLLLLPCLALAFTIQPEKIFVAWLFCAPLVQGASAGDHPHHAVFKAVFLVPPLILVARMALGAVDLRRLWVIDVVPALYLLYILIQIKLFPSELAGNESSLRAVYAIVGIGLTTYYFTALGKTSDRFPIAFAGSLLWSGVVVAALALVDASTGWNPWTHDVTGGDQVRRVVSTFGSPGALGTYLGVGVAFAVAILVWNGPRSMRLPAILLIGLSIPALYFTYTRGPILGIAAVATVMPLLATRARWASVLAFAAVGLLLFAGWKEITSSATYKARFGVTATVTTRAELADLQLELFRQKPLFGWGYNTFDQAKLTSPTRDPGIEGISSHNTFLTVLVELGITGLVLLVLPWAVISWRAIVAGWHGLREAWLIGATVGATVVYIIGALTYETRFFFVGVVPWIALGLARNVLSRGPQASYPNRA
jgi:hypothetical protein